MINKIRIGIDARIIDGQQGGVQQFIIGLAQGLSQLTDGDETYTFLAYQNQSDWIKPYIGGKCQLHLIPDPPQPPVWKRYLKRFDGLRQIWHRLRAQNQVVPIARSDGIIENLGIHLMHFTTQNGFLTDIPSMYHPWDLQHIHLPQFFTRLEARYRDVRYRTFCQQAKRIAVASTWIKNDLIRQYDIAPDKIIVVPMASVLVAYPQPTEDDLTHIQAQYGLPEMFAYYPAQTWAHKNHLGLLKALVILRDVYRITIPLVLTGTINAYGRTIRQFIQQNRLDNQVMILGYVSPLTVQALYRLSTMLVFPSRFEGWGLPITEAMSAGVPVICSDATHLPNIVGDAGIVINPDDTEGLANAMRDLWLNPDLRQTLIQKGYVRASSFNWDTTVHLFRAHYRQVLGVDLSADDARLLEQSPII